MPELDDTMSPSRSQSQWDTTCFRSVILFILVLQTSAMVLLLRYSRTHGEQQYLASTAVFLTEVCKFVVCVGMLLWQNGFSWNGTFTAFRDEITGKPDETIKLLVPSGLYTVQNNLLFVALTNLDAATYQVTYQLKILTTAVFSVCLLNKKLKSSQWFALLLLTVGVALVQMPSAKHNLVETSKSNATVVSVTATPDHVTQRHVIGLLAVLCACFSSGFAGVFYEKLVKTGNQPSVIIRNLQLGIFSLIFGFVAVIYNDFMAILDDGFFQGYNGIVVVIILLQAFGGLVVAVVIKYADNILKGFATSISIIVSSICSFVFLNDLSPGSFFLVGTSLVIIASFMYGSVQYATKDYEHSYRPTQKRFKEQP